MQTITKFKCGECDMIHEDEWYAETCCPTEIEKIIFYICPKCKSENETEKEAFECCGQTKLPMVAA